MNTPSHFRFPACRLGCGLLLMFLGGLVPAHAFFPEPDPLILDVGETATVIVRGFPAGAKVELMDVSNSALVTDDLTGTRTGTSFVKVQITAVAPGTTFLTFSGENNDEFATGSIQVIINPPVDTSAQSTQFATAGDPVNTRSGEYFASEGVDLNLGGPMPLLFSRYVASGLSQDDMVQANLGTNRSHNFASRFDTATSTNTRKRVVLPSGRVLRFDKVGTKWVLKSPLDVPFQLVETGGNFLLGHLQAKQIWTYDSTGKLTKIEDGKGNVHTLAYTGGALSSVSDGFGRSITITQAGGVITQVADLASMREVNYTYTGGVLTSVEDYGGLTTTYGNTGGLPTSVTNPLGNTPFTQAYTGGKVTSQTLRGTDTSTLDYSAGNSVFTDPVMEELNDVYDSSGRLISHVDQSGRAITMTYDSAGRRSSVTNREGRKTSFTYHAASGQMASMVNPEGKTTTFAYTLRKLSGLDFYDLTKITYPDGASRSFKYDTKGNLTQVTDEAGKAWKYTYNVNGQVLTSINPLGAVTTFQYDVKGNRISVQPPDEGTTQYGYDTPRGRLTLITRPGGATVALAYDSKDRVTSITDERGKVWTYTYNNNSRVTKITDPDLGETNITYDVMDRVESVTDRLGNATNMNYNAIGRLASVQDRNGNTVTATYNDRQLVESLTDPAGLVWNFAYDDEGRRVEMTAPGLPSPSTTQYQRNSLGNIVAVTDAEGNTVRLVRDAMQRVTASFDPLGRQTTFGYDKMGRLIQVTEQGTATAKYDRDALGNVSKITAPNGGVWATTRLKSGYVSKNTDPLGKSTTYTYTNRGRLAGAVFPDATTSTLSYDAAGNLTQEQFTHPQGPNLLYGYDNQNRLISANGISFEHDAEGRIINCPQDGMDFEADYDPSGRLISVEYRNGALVVSYAYDTRGRLIQVTDSVSQVDVDFTYDNQGHVTGITRTPGIDATFTYGASGRVTRIQEGTILDLIYTYNTAGDLISVDHTGPIEPTVAAGVQTFKYGKAGEITTAGYAYDALGRMTVSPGKTYGWNGVSNLISYSGVTLGYNGLGHLVSRTEAAATTQFQRHYALPGAPIVFLDAPGGGGSDTAFICTPDGKLLYSVDMTTQDASFYHFDRMGSTLVVTSEAEGLVSSYAYGPYGELLGSTGPAQPFTFLGRHGVRTEGAIYQMGARYYNPATACFISRDPLPPRLEDPASLNRYVYAASSPLRYIDPSGGKDEVSEIASCIMQSGTSLGLAVFVEIFDQVFDTSPKPPDPFMVMLNNIVRPPAPPALDIPWEEPTSGPSCASNFFPALPGGPVLLFPGFEINDTGGDDPLGGPPGLLDGGAGNGPPGGGLGGGLYFPPGQAFGGGIRVGSGDFDGDGVDDLVIANTTISANTAEGAPSVAESAAHAAARKATIQFFTDAYLVLQGEANRLLDKIIQSGGKKDKDTRDKLSAVDKQREIIGGIIINLGGTVPAPPK